MAEVSIQKVSKQFGDVHALDDVAIEVTDGSFHALLGPSGCGKTTLLRLIAGFENPDQGVISIGGNPIADTPPEKRDLGMVFQNYALFPNMSVQDNIGFGLSVRHIPRSEQRQRIHEVLALVRLNGLENRRPHQLSGGQRQRVALARAIVIQPRVLLLDEPLSALDKALRVDMQVELKRIQREVGITTIFVTHDQEEALALSDRLSILRNGVLIQDGAPREVYERPRTAFAAKFLGDANVLSGVYTKGALVLADGSRVHVSSSSHGVGDEFALAVRPEKIQVIPLSTTNGSSNHRPDCHSDDTNGNSIEAIVESHVFAGTSITYHLSWHGERIKVFLKNDGATLLEPGSAVRATWRPEHSILVSP